MGSAHERRAQVGWKLASALPEGVAADSIPETVVRELQKLASDGKALDLGRSIATAVPEMAVVGSIPEAPVQTSQKQTSVVVVERNPEPLRRKYAVPAASPISDPRPYTADSPAHLRQSGSHPADLLVEGADSPVAGSPL